MRLIALLAVLVLAGLLLGRLGPGRPSQPGQLATPGQTLRQVQQATDAASQAEQRRLDAAFNALR